MKHKVFIDGRAGTTGLRIEEYLSRRKDIELLNIDEGKRKDIAERLAKIAEADVTFLCLPDDGSREIVAALDAKESGAGSGAGAAGEPSLPDGSTLSPSAGPGAGVAGAQSLREGSTLSPSTGAKGARIIDASTAHRTADGWVYGLPELAPDQRSLIAESNRVAMAGCHAAGFILLVRPLIDAGIVPPDYPFAVHSVTGYSGGGKQMIAEYEKSGDALLGAPRQYALTQEHKHLPEMVKMSGANTAPHFSPHVADYYAGLEVVVPLHRRLLPDGAGAEDVRLALESRYACERFVRVVPDGENPEAGFLSACAMAGRNDVEIFVIGNEERILLTARYDNLGKGASGSGVQCMNIMLGLSEEDGL